MNKKENNLERSWVEIDLDAFRSNLKALKTFLKSEQGFIQVVKADAYGHGAWEITQAALKEGATALGVANLEEGKLLRIEGSHAWNHIFLTNCITTNHSVSIKEANYTTPFFIYPDEHKDDIFGQH